MVNSFLKCGLIFLFISLFGCLKAPETLNLSTTIPTFGYGTVDVVINSETVDAVRSNRNCQPQNNEPNGIYLEQLKCIYPDKRLEYGSVKVSACANTAFADTQGNDDFKIGDLVFLYQTQDQDEANAGQFAITKIVGVEPYGDGKKWYLDPPLTKRFISSDFGGVCTVGQRSGKAQAVRIPQLNTLLIEGGKFINASAWTPQSGTGGVLILMVKNLATIRGHIYMAGVGFRGGDGGGYGINHAQSGESWNGPGKKEIVRCGDQRQYNGGGGGNAGRYSADMCGGPGLSSPGAGGAYGTQPPDGDYWGGKNYGDIVFPRQIYLGSGGGGGYQDKGGNDTLGGFGMQGGGLIFLIARSVEFEPSGADSPSVDVMGGIDTQTSSYAGGSGSGGSVVLRLDTLVNSVPPTDTVVYIAGSVKDKNGNGGEGGSGRAAILHCGRSLSPPNLRTDSEGKIPLLVGTIECNN